MSWGVALMFIGALVNFGVAGYAVYGLGLGLTALTGLNILVGIVLVVLAIRTWATHD